MGDVIKNINLSGNITNADNPIKFSVDNLPGSPGVNGIFWNFGDPQSGPSNFNNKTLVPEHSFPLGAHLISLIFLSFFTVRQIVT